MQDIGLAELRRFDRIFPIRPNHRNWNFRAILDLNSGEQIKQQLVHDDSDLVVLVFNKYVSALSKQLSHEEVVGTWDLDGLEVAELWQFT
ncbi:hypothetical protein A8950_3480 [Dongia mobilis]|uniref:Uncharacterized protein n=1 Tax=Dongia mobilis TaxID=578943 RepID=A0A4R6WEW7_9PROT|nr:hypothetical protein A8950_3480 [Dongia mobilis]